MANVQKNLIMATSLKSTEGGKHNPPRTFQADRSPTVYFSTQPENAALSVQDWTPPPLSPARADMCSEY